MERENDDQEDDGYEQGENIPVLAVVLALGAALLGAGVWAGITITTDYEIGYVAWAIGGLVGLAATFVGGRGVSMGVIAAVLSLLAILAGKLTTAAIMVDREFKQVFTEEMHEELERDSAGYAALKDPSDDEALGEYLVKHDWVEGPDDLTEEQLTQFRELQAPDLLAFAAAPIPFEEWQGASISAASESVSLIEIVQESLEPVDLLFAFLGIATAFGICRRAAEG